MAEITDYFGKASVDDDHSVATTVSADRAAGVTVLSGFDLSTFTEDTPVFFITYTKTTDPLTGDVTITDLTSWKGLVNSGASTITNMTIAPGYTDTGNTEGQFIECIPTSYWGNQLVDGIQQEHNPDGTHSAITATSADVSGTVSTDTIAEKTAAAGVTIDGLQIKDSKLNTNNSVVTANITDAAVTSPKMAPTLLGGQFGDMNPIPSSAGDISGSSSTFTLTTASYLVVNFGCKFQLNTNLHATIYLNVDGSDVSNIQMGSGDAGVVLYMNSSRQVKLTLTAASHTIKLRAVASTGSASVAIEPFWYATVFSQ